MQHLRYTSLPRTRGAGQGKGGHKGVGRGTTGPFCAPKKACKKKGPWKDKCRESTILQSGSKPSRPAFRGCSMVAGALRAEWEGEHSTMEAWKEEGIRHTHFHTASFVP